MRGIRLLMSGFLVFLVACMAPLHAQDTIRLPAPVKEGGMPLMQALNERQSNREFSSEKLPLSTLSNLLWATGGVNRPDGRRTAPTARNMQEIDIYVALSDGLFVYDPKEHALLRILSEDIRAATGMNDYVKDAAVNLIYVADLGRANLTDPAAIEFYTGTDTSFMAQNAYLFGASEGLAVVVRGAIDRPALAKTMKLRDDQKITLAQSVGYPKKK